MLDVIMKQDYISLNKLKYKYDITDEQLLNFYSTFNKVKIGTYEFKYKVDYYKKEVYEFSTLIKQYESNYNEADNITAEIQGSLAIEGVYSSKKCINKIIEKENNSKAELEVVNLFNAYQFIKENQINETNIKTLYDILTKDIDLDKEQLDGELYRLDKVGIYKSTGREIATGIDAKEIKATMDNLILYIKTLVDYPNNDELLKYGITFIIHFIFVFIHPYYDRNGRMARLLQNWVLIQCYNENILPTAEIIKYDKNNYYNAIQDVRDADGDLNYFLKYMFSASNKLYRSKLTVNELENYLMNQSILLTEHEKNYITILLMNYNKEDKFNWRRFLGLLKLIDDEKSKEGCLKILNNLEQKNILISKLKNKTKLFRISPLVLRIKADI